MKKINVGILTDQFIDWGGGIDFIRLILNGLNSINETGDVELNIYVYVPNKSELKIKLKNIIKFFLNKFFGHKYKQQKIISKKLFLETFKSIKGNISVYYYNGTEGDLAKKVVQHNVDFVLPVANPFISNFPTAWAGYIYDFQHKYYPEFFTEENRDNRDRDFLSMLTLAKTVIVNAKSVKDDITRFVGATNAKVVSLPFCPVLNLDFFKTDINLDKYNLPENYFMISNQFWKHKDHATAFKAFRLFLDKIENEDVYLICTGQTHDGRFPDYFNSLQNLIVDLNLKDKIIILGYIPKQDQLQVLKKCIGIIQPTLFEGGPGGGAVYESVAYGIPSIVSEIPVNVELEDETVTFFKTGSPEDLCDKMLTIFYSKRVNYSIDELILKNQKARLRMGEQILSIIQTQ